MVTPGVVRARTCAGDTERLDWLLSRLARVGPTREWHVEGRKPLPGSESCAVPCAAGRAAPAATAGVRRAGPLPSGRGARRGLGHAGTTGGAPRGGGAAGPPE